MNSTGSLIFGSQPFFDATGAPLALGYLKTTLAGVVTLQTTFSDVGCTVPNPNSNTLANTLRLDAGGFPESPMYFASVPSGTSAVAYDIYLYDVNQALVRTIEDVIVPMPSASGNATSVVLGFGTEPSLTIAGGSITPTTNNFIVLPEGGSADNLDTIAVTGIPDGAPIYFRNGNGSAPITIRHGIDNIICASGNVVLSATTQEVVFKRSGSSVRQISVPTTQDLGNDAADGRLTLVSGDPAPTGTSNDLGTLYYTPYVGNHIDLYDGTSAWSRLAFAELSLSLSSVVIGSNYDVFCYNNNGTATMVLGTAWTTVVTRALGLSRQNGVLVLTSNTTYRYLGTIYGTDTGKTSDSQDRRTVFNYYHPLPRTVKVTDANSPWSYNTAAWRVSDNLGTTNAVLVTCGIVEQSVDLTAVGVAVMSNAGQIIGTGIGINSQTVPGVSKGQVSGTSVASGVVVASATYTDFGTLGTILYYWLEYGSGTGSATWYGTSAALAGGVRGGLTGYVWC